MTSDDDYQTPSMSRREALSGGSAAAVAVGAGLMSSSLVRRAQALSAGDARIVMGDQGSSPAQNGELTHNTGDVEVYSGGSVRNLTSPAFEDVEINNSVTYPDGTTYTTHPNVDGTNIKPAKVYNQVAYAEPGGGSTKGIQARIDEMNAEGGGVVIPTPGTYERGSNDSINVKDNVTVDGMSIGRAAFTIADNLDDNAPTIFVIGAGVTDAHIKNVEIDGNESNNRAATQQPFQQTGISIGDQSNSTNDRPVRCSVENVYAHDTIRNGLVMAGDRCTARNVWAKNSQVDHLVYVARGLNCTLENIWCSGFTGGGGMLDVGTSNFPAYGNELENIWFFDPATNPENSEFAWLALNLRPGSEASDTHVDGCHLRYTSGENGQTVLTNHDSTIEGFTYRGPQEQKHGILMDNGPADVIVDNPHMVFTDTSRTDGRFITHQSGGMDVNNAILKEPNTAVFRGIAYFGDGVIQNPRIEGVGQMAVSTFTGSGDEIEVGLYNLRTDASQRVSVVGDASSTYFAHQSMVPQRLTDISAGYLFDGRMNFNDGGGGNTEGPAYYDEGNTQWVSIVDGTTW